MPRETVQLMNMIIENLCDKTLDDVELIIVDISAGRTTMNLKSKNRVVFSVSANADHNCGGCKAKIPAGIVHDCPTPITGKPGRRVK